MGGGGAGREGPGEGLNKYLKLTIFEFFGPTLEVLINLEKNFQNVLPPT